MVNSATWTAADTDPQALFEGYQRRMAELRAQNRVYDCHLTMPLTSSEGGCVLERKLRGMNTARPQHRA